MAYSINSVKDNLTAALDTVSYWRRINTVIPINITLSIINGLHYKNITITLDKRLEHSLYKGIVAIPLIYSPILLILAIFIAVKAFRDYNTIKELLNIASYFSTKLRSIINNLFRSLSLPYNPKLYLKYINIEEEIAALKGKKDELYIQKRKLTAKELYKPDVGDKDNTSLYYYRTIFNRTQFLIPKRDRLISILFKVAALRSPIGLNALLEFRPGLELEKCRYFNLVGQQKTA
ncbi:hypothetical protein V2W45_1466421 [Cenococcum geophilum]